MVQAGRLQAGEDKLMGGSIKDGGWEQRRMVSLGPEAEAPSQAAPSRAFWG